MDQDFALTHKITLEKLPCTIWMIVIDGQPIAFGNLVEEFELVYVVLEELACVISFNIISSPKQLIQRLIGKPKKFVVENNSIHKFNP